MEVICIETAAFYALIDKVVMHVEQKHNIKADQWISGEEVMKMLRITSKTTLQKLRDEGKIKFFQEKKEFFMISIQLMST